MKTNFMDFRILKGIKIFGQYLTKKATVSSSKDVEVEHSGRFC